MSDSTPSPMDFCIPVYYPCGAGGKFIINSLSLSRHCVLHDTATSQWELSQSKYDGKFYQEKLRIVLSTVPLTQKNPAWQKYELGVGYNWCDSDGTLSQYCQQFTAQKKFFCLIFHEPEDLDRFLEKNSNSKNLIKLTNYCEWMSSCQWKFSVQVDHMQDKISYWRFIDTKEINSKKYLTQLVDIDNSMHDIGIMSRQIESLYQHFGFDDWNYQIWSEYYNHYMSAH